VISCGPAPSVGKPSRPADSDRSTASASRSRDLRVSSLPSFGATRHPNGRFIEAPVSSHPMVGDAGSGTYLCSLCRAEMPLDQRRAHYRALHPAIFEQQQRALARGMRIVVPVAVGSGILLFLALFVPGEILRVRMPDWYLVVVTLGFLGAIFALVPSAAKSRRTYFEPYGSFLVPCVVCAEKIREQDLRPHFASVHSEELRYFRITRWVARGAPYGITLYGILVATFLSPFGLIVWLPLLPSVGLFVLWAVFTRHHWRNARAVWQKKD